MAKIKKSLGKFIFTEDNKEHFVQEVQAEYEMKNGDISRFKGKMECPECSKAKLGFRHKTHKRREYAFRIPSSSHEENCSYNYHVASKRNIYKYVNSLNPQQIQDKLETVVNMLMCNEDKSINAITSGIKKIDRNPLVIPINRRYTSTLNAIRTKSLNLWLDELDQKETYIFYGRVKLAVENIKGKNLKEDGTYPEFYKLHIYTLDKNCEVRRRRAVFRGHNKDEIVEGEIYYIAIIGQADFSYAPIEISPITDKCLFYRKVGINKF